MWLPWRRKSSRRERGDRGRHSVVVARAAFAESTLPASAAPPVAAPPFAAPPVAAPPPAPLGAVGLVFTDGSEWLLPADDDRGEPWRAVAAALSAGGATSN